jgi:hypothetical protein
MCVDRLFGLHAFADRAKRVAHHTCSFVDLSTPCFGGPLTTSLEPMTVYSDLIASTDHISWRKSGSCVWRIKLYQKFVRWNFLGSVVCPGFDG